MSDSATVSGLGREQQNVLDQLLMEAVGNQDLAHVKLYVEKGADVNMSVGTLYANFNRNSRQVSFSRTAPLMHFLYNKGLRSDVADYLIAQGADVDARDGLGNTPLMMAVKTGDLSAAKYFISKGADPLAKNNAGEIVLEEARGLQPYYHSYRQEIIDALMHAMPDVGQRPKNETPAVELPPQPAQTPLQKRLNKKFNP